MSKKSPDPEPRPKPKRVGVSGPEKMFWDEMDKIGATVEASIVRKTRDWMTDLYRFQITRADGSKVVGDIAWDMDTFGNVLKIAKGEKS